MPDKNSQTLMTWWSAIGRRTECDRISAPAVIARIGARGKLSTDGRRALTTLDCFSRAKMLCANVQRLGMLPNALD